LREETQKITRRDCGDSQLIAALKITHIVSDDIAAIRRKCQFQYHIIVRIRKKRTPEKVDFLMMHLAGEITQKNASASSAFSPGGKCSGRVSTSCHSE
jgi:hypothetical protein